MDFDVTPSLNQQLARTRRYAEILTDFARVAPDTSDIDHLLQLACVQAARGIGISHSKMLRYRPEAGDLLMVAGVGWKPGVVGHTSLGSDVASLPGRAFQTGQAVIVEDTQNNPEFRYPPVLREHNIASALNVPIVNGGVIWGVAEVDSETPRHFGADDVQFLCGLGNILGLALQARMRLQRVTEAEATTALALAQERTLLEELRHRSRNDLQLILSMLILQRRKQTDEQAKRGFSHIMDRVTAIGFAHDQLTPGGGALKVELADYLQTLCGNLRKRRENVEVKTSLVACEMPHERAVPLGLIVNELATNALKHAFPESRSGTISVNFETTPEGEGVLQVCDDGVGMGPPRLGSSGTELVKRLVQQVGGNLEQLDMVPGTGFVIRFPLVT
ncbi:MAG: sensor histidine kinase [Janthinobacterium lividum]